MEKYLRTLDLLFDSNYKTIGPEAMKDRMKQYLDRDHDIVGGSDYVIREWKDMRLKYEQEPLSIKALEMLWLMETFLYTLVKIVIVLILVAVTLCIFYLDNGDF